MIDLTSLVPELGYLAFAGSGIVLLVSAWVGRSRSAAAKKGVVEPETSPSQNPPKIVRTFASPDGEQLIATYQLVSIGTPARAVETAPATGPVVEHQENPAGPRPASVPDHGAEIMGYCLTKKERALLQLVRPVTLKNGAKAAVGICTKCGKEHYRMGPLPPGFGSTSASTSTTVVAATSSLKVAGPDARRLLE